MYSAKKGFLLTDALISILCVALLATAVSAAVRIHAGINETIKAKIEETDEEFNTSLSSHIRCGLCEHSEEEDPY